LLSRVADATYWTSRYVERAENVARFVDVNVNLTLDLPIGVRPSWDSLIVTTGDQDWFFEHYGKATKENTIQFLTFDKRYPNSILSTVTCARENAQTIRDVISREMWQELNSLYLFVKDAAASFSSDAEAMIEFYNRVKLASIYFEGVTNATLTRGEAWHFARLGRMLERADKTSRILDVKHSILIPKPGDVGTTIDQVELTALLNSASALQMYRQQYQVIAPTSVTEFLLLNPNFPRSIHHCVSAAQESLRSLSGTPTQHYANEADRRLGQLRASLDYGDVAQIVSGGLHQYLDGLQRNLNDIGMAIDERFFHPRW
jgi:uncharacterized alpha-E superfamily protein